MIEHYPAGPVKRIHIDRARALAWDDAVIVVELDGGRRDHARSVDIRGPSRVLYEPIEHFQPVRAFAWIETTAALDADLP